VCAIAGHRGGQAHGALGKAPTGGGVGNGEVGLTQHYAGLAGTEWTTHSLRHFSIRGRQESGEIEDEDAVVVGSRANDVGIGDEQLAVGVGEPAGAPEQRSDGAGGLTDDLGGIGSLRREGGLADNGPRALSGEEVGRGQTAGGQDECS